MVWGPFYLAVIFGLMVSAVLYFVLLWPSREPDPDAVDPDTLEPTEPARPNDPDS